MKSEMTTLIREVAAISKKYDKIAKAEGENFNIFKILNLSTNETRTHSSFLAELLDPRGSHGQGSIFLELFLRQLNIEDFEVEGAIVQKEQNAGRIDIEYLRGGRMDIVLSDKYKRGIVIENKIYTGDQKNQLSRYFEYCVSNFRNGFYILYLTLDGKKPSDWGLGLKSQDEKFQNCFATISFASDILNWLEMSRVKVAHSPTLTHSIAQYANLLKELTCQSMKDAASREITEYVLKSGLDSITAVHNIHDEIYGAVNVKLMNMFKNQILEIADELPLKLDNERIDGLGDFESGFYFRDPSWRHMRIGFEFAGKQEWATQLCYGITGITWGARVPYDNKMFVPLGVSEDSTDTWPWWKYFDIRNWNSLAFRKVVDGTLKAEVKGLVARLKTEIVSLNLPSGL